MLHPPKWAQKLTIKAILYLQENGYEAELPTLIWKHRTGNNSSGTADTDNTKIVITAGKSRIDAKLVLLHEIAHIVTKDKIQYLNIERAKKNGWIFLVEPIEPRVVRRISHTDAFWDIAWQLYRWAKLPIRYCQKREYNYKAGAAIAYRRNRKRDTA